MADSSRPHRCPVGFPAGMHGRGYAARHARPVSGPRQQRGHGAGAPLHPDRPAPIPRHPRHALAAAL